MVCIFSQGDCYGIKLFPSQKKGVANEEPGLSLEAVGLLHSVTHGQVSRRLSGWKGEPHGYRMHISVSCRYCGAVFSTTKASALYCCSACRLRAFRAKQGGLSDDSHAVEGTDLCGR